MTNDHEAVGAAGEPIEPTLISADGLVYALSFAAAIESRVHDLIRLVNARRNNAGLGAGDPIYLEIPEADADLLAYRSRLMSETMAERIEAVGDSVNIVNSHPLRDR